MGDDETAKAETRATTAFVLDQALKLLHPFMPFVTEELWAQTGTRDTQLITAAWPVLDGLTDSDAQAEMDWLIGLVTDLRRLRAEMNIPPGAQLDVAVIGASPETLARLERQDVLVKRMARLANVTPSDSAPQASAQTVVGEASFALLLAGVIDFDAERARIGKEIARLDGETKRLEGKLSNERFIANAPEALVAEQREKLADYATQRGKMAEALERLAAM
jgi:valyl-tRNA synthetase